LLLRFHSVLHLFVAFLVLAGVKMWWAAGKESSLDHTRPLSSGAA
jgi:tellurite resistance protein TerC